MITLGPTGDLLEDHCGQNTQVHIWVFQVANQLLGSDSLQLLGVVAPGHPISLRRFSLIPFTFPFAAESRGGLVTTSDGVLEGIEVTFQKLLNSCSFNASSTASNWSNAARQRAASARTSIRR